MNTNDMKKGTRIKLSYNGWEAKLMNNKKGNIRDAEVYGIYTELSSVYSHNIVAYQDNAGNWQTDVEYSKGQIQCKQMNDAMGF